MNLYIIGNGFDLFHNMKTRFEDFRDFLSDKDFTLLSEFETFYSITNNEGYLIKEWNNLEEILS